MSLSDSFLQGLSAPVPVAGAGLPDDLTLYVGGPLDPLKQHVEKYKQLARRQRMSDRASKKMLSALEESENQYEGHNDLEEDMDKVSYISSNPLLRRQYLLKAAQTPPITSGDDSTPLVQSEGEDTPNVLTGDDLPLAEPPPPPPQEFSLGPKDNFHSQRNEAIRNHYAQSPEDQAVVQNLMKARGEEPFNFKDRIGANVSPPMDPQPTSMLSTPTPTAEEAPPAPSPVENAGMTEALKRRIQNAEAESISPPVPPPPQAGPPMGEVQRIRQDDSYKNRLSPAGIATARDAQPEEEQGYSFNPLPASWRQKVVDAYEGAKNLIPGASEPDWSYDKVKPFVHPPKGQFFNKVMSPQEEARAKGERVPYRKSTDPVRTTNPYEDWRHRAQYSAARAEDATGRALPVDIGPTSLSDALGRAYNPAMEGLSRAYGNLGNYGGRILRQGTQGLQQLANFGLRNSDYLSGLVDKDQQAQILASLAEGATDAGDEAFYLNQLRALHPQKMSDKLYSSNREERYNALKNRFLTEQAKVRGLNPKDPEVMKQVEIDFGPGFDKYYGRGDEAKRLGVPRLDQDSFGAIASDIPGASYVSNAYRRALDSLPALSQVTTNPQGVVRYSGGPDWESRVGSPSPNPTDERVAPPPNLIKERMASPPEINQSKVRPRLDFLGNEVQPPLPYMVETLDHLNDSTQGMVDGKHRPRLAALNSEIAKWKEHSKDMPSMSKPEQDAMVQMGQDLVAARAELTRQYAEEGINQIGQNVRDMWGSQIPKDQRQGGYVHSDHLKALNDIDASVRANNAEGNAIIERNRQRRAQGSAEEPSNASFAQRQENIQQDLESINRDAEALDHREALRQHITELKQQEQSLDEISSLLSEEESGDLGEIGLSTPTEADTKLEQLQMSGLDPTAMHEVLQSTHPIATNVAQTLESLPDDQVESYIEQLPSNEYQSLLRYLDRSQRFASLPPSSNAPLYWGDRG